MEEKIFLILCLVIATQLGSTRSESRGYFKEDFPEEKIPEKISKEKCKDTCDNDNKCMIWQWHPTKKICWIMKIIETSSDTNSVYASKKVEDLPICQEFKGDRNNKKLHIQGVANRAICKTSCNKNQDCIIWQFDRNKCYHHIVEVGKGDAVVGIRCRKVLCGTPNNREKRPRSKFNRIKGGNEDKYPWQVYVDIPGDTKDEKGRCGGTIISDQSILTAAHCVHKLQSQQITVKIGAAYITSTLPELKIKKVEVHPFFDSYSLENDIAVLTLENIIRFDKDRIPICIPTDKNYMRGEDHENKKVTAIGWGLTGNSNDDPNKLRSVLLQTINNQACRQIFKIIGAKYYQINVLKQKPFCDQICAIDKEKGILKGDSGGPIMYEEKEQFFQLGVIIWSPLHKVQGADHVSLSTRIASHLKFIEMSKTGYSLPQN